MKHFSPKEFHGFYKHLDDDLKVKLDDLRDNVGQALYLSEIPGGIARRLGSSSTSDHNLDRWGCTRGVDGYIPEGISYKEFYELALVSGFNAVGLYSGWPSGRRGFHVGTRKEVPQGAIKKWCGIWNNETNENEYREISFLFDKDE
jgi:hypothetical protein